MSIQIESARRRLVTTARGRRQDQILHTLGCVKFGHFCFWETWGRCPRRWNVRRGKLKRDGMFVLRVNAVDRAMLDTLAGAIGRSRGATVRLLVQAGAAELAAAAVARRAIQQQGGAADDH